MIEDDYIIYNSRNYKITIAKGSNNKCTCIYNSRNYKITIAYLYFRLYLHIYNSRNYKITIADYLLKFKSYSSTIVEIIKLL